MFTNLHLGFFLHSHTQSRQCRLLFRAEEISLQRCRRMILTNFTRFITMKSFLFMILIDPFVIFTIRSPPNLQKLLHNKEFDSCKHFSYREAKRFQHRNSLCVLDPISRHQIFSSFSPRTHEFAKKKKSYHHRDFEERSFLKFCSYYAMRFPIFTLAQCTCSCNSIPALLSNYVCKCD